MNPPYPTFFEGTSQILPAQLAVHFSEEQGYAESSFTENTSCFRTSGPHMQSINVAVGVGSFSFKLKGK